MPPDLSHTIVFTTSGLKRLRTRIDELKDEKEELRKNQKQLRSKGLQPNPFLSVCSEAMIFASTD
jgi:hypothetical protein